MDTATQAQVSVWDSIVNTANSLVGTVLTYQAGQQALNSPTQQPAIAAAASPAPNILGISNQSALLLAAGLALVLVIPRVMK